MDVKFITKHLGTLEDNYLQVTFLYIGIRECPSVQEFTEQYREWSKIISCLVIKNFTSRPWFIKVRSNSYRRARASDVQRRTHFNTPDSDTHHSTTLPMKGFPVCFVTSPHGSVSRLSSGQDRIRAGSMNKTSSKHCMIIIFLAISSIISLITAINFSGIMDYFQTKG